MWLISSGLLCGLLFPLLVSIFEKQLGLEFSVMNEVDCLGKLELREAWFVYPLAFVTLESGWTKCCSETRKRKNVETPHLSKRKLNPNFKMTIALPPNRKGAQEQNLQTCPKSCQISLSWFHLRFIYQISTPSILPGWAFY